MRRRPPLLPFLPVLPLLCGWAFGAAELPEPPNPASLAAYGDLLLREVYGLVSSCGPRPAGSAAAAKATEWVAGRLTAAKIPFTRSGGTVAEAGEAWERIAKLGHRIDSDIPLRNLAADFPLPDQPPPDLEGRILVIAHTDSAQGAPGAEDDASGVSVALDLARFLREHPPRRRVTVLFSDGEEIGLLGAALYADRLTPEERSELLAVWALEMQGWRSPPFLHWFRSSSMPLDPAPADAVIRLVQAAGAAAGVNPGIADPLVGWIFPAVRDQLTVPLDTDHRPFAQLGLSSFATATSSLSGFYPWYHTPDDTPERLDPAALAANATLLRAGVHALSSTGDLDPARGGYPICGRTIPLLWLRLALLFSGLTLLIIWPLYGCFGSFALFGLAALPSIDLLAPATVPIAAFLVGWSAYSSSLLLRRLAGVFSLVPLLAAIGVVVAALLLFPGSRVEPAIFSDLLVLTALVQLFLLAWKREAPGPRPSS